MAYFVIFSFIPMGGLIMAFQKYNLMKGIFGSKFVGFDNFTRFFKSIYCWRVIRNTLVISGLDLLFAFPAPIILAFMLNETRNQIFKRSIQTITYMPYFISMVVICGLIVNFTDSEGVVTLLVNSLGGKFDSLIASQSAFRTIFISTNIWQTIGFNSIIYLAALSSVDQDLYEASRIDGAGYFKQWLHITLPGISSTIVIMLILRVGQTMNVNFEKIILLYNTSTYEVADVITSYIYRCGLLNGEYSYSTAIGLFNSVIGFLLIVLTNALSKKYTETSLF
jgi:ABC-type polysaccharide transport system, permease component